MIAKVLPRRGPAGQTRSSARRLMRYLLGPGDLPAAESREEFGELGNAHTEPRVVASWDRSRAVDWARACRAVDWTRPADAWADLAKLARGVADCCAEDLDRVRGGLKRNAVWHTVMAADPRDGLLTDEQWEQVASMLMHETGLHPLGSENPVRWAAVRHGCNDAGADHIHVMAVLVRADGSKPRMHNDALGAQRAARWAETTFGLVAGRARTTASQPRSRPQRPDPTPRRGEQAAAAKRGPLYQRPAGMSDQVWERVRRQGQERSWTRQGRARAGVLSAAARAVSTDHLVVLLREQGYQVRLRYSVRDPGQVTGWSVVAPADRPGGTPKSYRGATLGADCTWPSIRAHIDRLSQARGTGLVGQGQEEAMIGRERMIAAGWGLELIEQVTTTDRLLAEGAQPGTDAAWWLRDVMWQTAWELEGRHKRHGVFTDAAYAYAAIAAGGVPPVPTEAVAAMTRLRQQYDQVLSRLGQIDREREAREREDGHLAQVGRQWDAWADSLGAGARPHLPYYLAMPGGQRLTGTAWVATSLAAQDIRRHADALAQAAAVHQANSARLDEQAAVAQAARDEVAAISTWTGQAKTYEAELQSAIDAHTSAREQWRDAIGRLLADARELADVEAVDRIEALDARYGATGAAGRPLYGVPAAR